MEIVTKIAPIALALMMLGLGTSLTINDFTRVIKNPKDFLVGLICQLILLPVIAFALIKLLNVSSELALGVMIIAAAPGGVTSNVLTKFANGDVALSVSLTAIISLISIVTVPFIIINSIDFFDIAFNQKEISMKAISLKMFLVVTVPVILGIIIRNFAKNFINKYDQIIQKISVLLFMLVFLAIYIEEWENIAEYILKAGLITLILNIVMMAAGYYIAKLFINGMPKQKSIDIECGLQNGTLAVFVATQIFDNINYLIPTASYALIMMVTSVFFVIFIKKAA